MKDKNHDDYINELRTYSTNLLMSETNVRQFLKDAGIHTKSGKLTKEYSDVVKNIKTTSSKK